MLRFTISFTHSYSSDELSAITRLNFNGLSNILEFGVMKGDMHPAGVQLFEEFWSSLFGTSELALRFPFVLMGVLAIWLTYLIAEGLNVCLASTYVWPQTANFDFRNLFFR